MPLQSLHLALCQYVSPQSVCRGVFCLEHNTLFLERPYISGAGPEAKEQAVQALVGLAKRKAEELGVLLVLSQDYGVYQPRGFTQTRLHVYISKSKGGAQYLDSLDGEAAVSKEGSYLANRFLIQN